MHASPAHFFNEYSVTSTSCGPLRTIEDAKFKTFGCGSAIASSSYVTELVKGKHIEEAMTIKNTVIVNELNLPPVKIHCSVLAEDAIKAAITDWKAHQAPASADESKKVREG